MVSVYVATVVIPAVCRNKTPVGQWVETGHAHVLHGPPTLLMPIHGLISHNTASPSAHEPQHDAVVYEVGAVMIAASILKAMTETYCDSVSCIYVHMHGTQ